MALTGESLVSFTGQHEMLGLAHVRVYEQPGRRPVVIAGQLTDNPGPPVAIGVETVAATIAQAYFSEGREFQLLTYEPTDLLGNCRFLRVDFAHRNLADDPDDPSHYAGQILTIDDAGGLHEAGRGPAKPGDYRDPTWHPVADPEQLTGCPIQTWPKDQYTISALFGADGAALREQVLARNHAIGDRITSAIDRLASGGRPEE